MAAARASVAGLYEAVDAQWREISHVADPCRVMLLFLEHRQVVFFEMAVSLTGEVAEPFEAMRESETTGYPLKIVQ
jgi:hypothetical protein